MSFTLYWARGACSFSPHVVLEELGVPFEAKKIDPTKGDNQTPEYLKLNARGHVPVLVHDDFVLTESAAIATYLGDLHPAAQLTVAAGTRERAQLQELQGLLSSALHIYNRQIFRPARFTTDPAGHDAIKASGEENWRKTARDLEQRLSKRPGPWFFGEQYTVADPYLYTLHRMASLRRADLTEFTFWNAHAERTASRPAVKRALEREDGVK